MSDIRTQILLAMAGVPEGFEPFAAAYRGVVENKWTVEDIDELQKSLPTPASLRTEIGKLKRRLSRPRKPYRTRARREGERGRGTFGRAVKRHSIDAALDMNLRDGAVRLLELLINRGTRRPIEVCTNWLATDLRRTTRTVQTYYRQLEAQGYFDHLSVNRKTGRTTIVLSARCEPPPWRPKHSSKNKASRLTSSGDQGAKFSSHTVDIKSDSICVLAFHDADKHAASMATTAAANPASARIPPGAAHETASDLQACSPQGTEPADRAAIASTAGSIPLANASTDPTPETGDGEIAEASTCRTRSRSPRLSPLNGSGEATEPSKSFLTRLMPSAILSAAGRPWVRRHAAHRSRDGPG